MAYRCLQLWTIWTIGSVPETQHEKLRDTKTTRQDTTGCLNMLKSFAKALQRLCKGFAKNYETHNFSQTVRVGARKKSSQNFTARFFKANVATNQY